ncbi:proline dehydrogenase family protein [Xanthovirga aplysinae]|uniref:proline dehydrogenase family protein n=1 Tax=Xanthovirga aplysinae TaxID=2529853 RepID=UPI0012BCF370|nr:proline dehydrogenase family protein [Xanthovirga aplysinae]MTI32603.1 proline dehydrogenase [Xanthovirga aplysinae]
MKRRVSFDDISVAFSSKSDKALMKTYLIFAGMNNHTLMKMGTSSIKGAFKVGLPISSLIKNTIFEQFCGGETIEECEPTIKLLGKFNVGTILDYSIEGEKTEAGFQNTTQETIRTIEKAHRSPHVPFSVFKVTGLSEFALLEKVQAGEELNESEKEAFQRAIDRIDRICEKAHELNVPIFIDAEESWIQDAVDRIVYAMMAKYNKEKPIVYNTYQMYRHDMLGRLKEAFSQANKSGYKIGAKLVRGAYMEKESLRAAQMGYTNPIQPDKESSDRDYNLALEFCVENIDRISLCSGSHNEYSNYLLVDLMEKQNLKPNDERVYFAQLFGMSDNISFNLAKAGYNVAKYVPYGPVKSVMPYLFRRAEENSSIAGQSSREYLMVKDELQRRKAVKKH